MREFDSGATQHIDYPPGLPDATKYFPTREPQPPTNNLQTLIRFASVCGRYGPDKFITAKRAKLLICGAEPITIVSI